MPEYAVPKNLYLDRRLVACAQGLVDKRQARNRSYSLSQMVQDLLVVELKRHKIKLPGDFA